MFGPWNVIRASYRQRERSSRVIRMSFVVIMSADVERVCGISPHRRRQEGELDGFGMLCISLFVGLCEW